MTHHPRHLWIVGPTAPTVATLVAAHGLPPVLAAVSAHRRLRGPYTAAGEVVRLITPDVLRTRPGLAADHDVELLAVAPELGTSVPLRRATLTTLTTPRNRTRFYPRDRTTRLAHGLTEFLQSWTGPVGAPFSLIVTDVDDADRTDIEWLGILLRRFDPALGAVVVHSRGTDLPDPLGTALRRYADRFPDPGGQPAVPGPAVPDSDSDSAAIYIAGDCTSPDPGLIAGYERTDPATRARLHDARAAELEELDQPSLRLGAIPLHLERGSDPYGAGARALLEAIEHCVLEGFYDAVIDLGPRCFAVLDWQRSLQDCWLVTAKVTTALSALDRAEDAEDYYDLACAASTDPSVHLQSAYGRAMLFTRFFRGSRRNHAKAKAWVNTAISLSQLLPDEQRRAFNITFNENGLALVEMHLGDLAEARRLVDTGIARLDAQVDPEQHTQHRSVLAYNRAQLLAATGPVDEALAAYADVIAADPHHSEYYFERASLLRRAGRLTEAMADLEVAIAESPPYPEPHFNRGDLAAALGDPGTALAEFSYVIELEPTMLDAYLRRAALLLEAGDCAGAASDVAAGLVLQSDDARLHCLGGLVALEQEDPVAARAAFDRAIMFDPGLAEALANRAVLRFDAGDVDGAIDDLTQALAVSDDPAIRENRAHAYLTAGRLREAVVDCETALLHDDADVPSLTELLHRCRREAEQSGPSSAGDRPALASSTP